jgi:hypothetical protein
VLVVIDFLRLRWKLIAKTSGQAFLLQIFDRASLVEKTSHFSVIRKIRTFK